MVNPLLQIKAGLKYLMSLGKHDWTINDYPIRIRHFKTLNADLLGSRLKPIPWSAQIVNWWQINGFGDTKEAALADLRAKFQSRKEEGKGLPRPGTGLPFEFEFAPSNQIALHLDIAEDFFRRILEIDVQDCLISDESTLWDFHGEESNQHLHQKVWESYRIDISDIEDGNLVKIFERIENR
jgi:hypothetical protein